MNCRLLYKKYLEFGKEFEEKYIGQGMNETVQWRRRLISDGNCSDVCREKSLTALIRRFLINIINRLKKNKLECRETDPFRVKIKAGKEEAYGSAYISDKRKSMLAKNSLALAKQGYDLMDKKRNILIRD